MPEGSFLKLVLPAAPWALKEDGRLHEYSLVLALRLGAMPGAPLPLFNGGAPPAQGDKVRHAAAAPPLLPIPPTPPMLPQPRPHPQPRAERAQVESVQLYKISPLYLPCISPISPLYLQVESVQLYKISPLYLPYISPVSPLYLQVESVQLYKNGGVGALNDMGTQEAAVHAERWCWLVVTRKKGAPRTSLAHLAHPRALSTLLEHLAPPRAPSTSSST